MPVARFLDVFEIETNKMKENAVALFRLVTPCGMPHYGTVLLYLESVTLSIFLTIITYGEAMRYIAQQ